VSTTTRTTTNDDELPHPATNTTYMCIDCDNEHFSIEDAIECECL